MIENVLQIISKFLGIPKELLPLSTAIAIYIIFDLHLREKMRNPQKKEPERTPKLPKKKLNDANGIIFGKIGKKVMYSPSTDESHCLIVAGSGAGKTSAVAIPSVRSFCKQKDGKIDGTCYCIDISGDIHTNCDIPNKLVFDIEDPNTIPYNIFAEVDSKDSYEEKKEVLEKLAYMIIPEVLTADTNGADAYFKNNGRNLLIGALLTYYYEGMDFVPICEKILMMDYKALCIDIVDGGRDDAIRYIASYQNANEKNLSGCKSELDNAIRLYGANHRTKYSLRRPKDGEIAIEPKLLKNHNIFLCIPDAMTDVYGPLLGICTAQIFNFCAARPIGDNPNVLMVLDEFASLKVGAQDILNAVRKFRKRSVRIMILTQSINDLDILYGVKVRNAIMSNLKYKLILGITDPDSQSFFSDTIGKKEIRTKTYTQSGRSSSQSYSTRDEYIVRPEEFGQLKDKLYLITDEGTYIKLNKAYYFK